ncbi:MAG: hypothetical protein DELT_01500 [Desulfovibrio sp.]
MQTLTVNGEKRAHENGMTVASLLAEIVNSAATVVVEVNGLIIPRERFDATPLNAGDTVEIVHFVGGG